MFFYYRQYLYSYSLPLHPILTQFYHIHSVFIWSTFSFFVVVYSIVLLQFYYFLYMFQNLKPKLTLRVDTPQDDTPQAGTLEVDTSQADTLQVDTPYIDMLQADTC